MTFFYDLNKKLSELDKPKTVINEDKTNKQTAILEQAGSDLYQKYSIQKQLDEKMFVDPDTGERRLIPKPTLPQSQPQSGSQTSSDTQSGSEPQTGDRDNEIKPKCPPFTPASKCNMREDELSEMMRLASMEENQVLEQGDADQIRQGLNQVGRDMMQRWLKDQETARQDQETARQNRQFRADVDTVKSGNWVFPNNVGTGPLPIEKLVSYNKDRKLDTIYAADRLQPHGVDIPGLAGNRVNPSTLDSDLQVQEEDDLSEMMRLAGMEENQVLEQGIAEGKGDGNLANNAKPYKKITRGDVIAGRLGKDEMGGKMKFAKEAKVRQGKKGDIETTRTGLRHTRRYDVKTGETPGNEPNDPGRPTGPKHTYDAPFGRIEIPAWKGPRTVHSMDPDVKKGRPKKVKEELDDQMIHPADRGEYDREGDMAKTQLSTAEDAANELRSILDSEENLPEWVQAKITKAVDYLDTARDYMVSKKDQEEPLAEKKAVSGAQQRAAAIALKAKREGHRPKKGTASAAMTDMSTAELKKFAKTKRTGLPKHVEKKVDETTTSGSVAVSDSGDSPKQPKGKKAVSFGKGIYDSWNRELENMISESMSITVSQNSNDNGAVDKSISITASGEDAERLAEILNLAGMHDDHYHSDEHSCPVCDQEPCGCSQMVDENSPNWPTDTEYNDDALQYSGGLNRPKSTGQSTVPVLASQLDRQMSEDIELSQLKNLLRKI